MSPCFSRRRFLQSSLAATAALTILPGGSARTYAANTKVNVGIIGVGGQGGVNRKWLERVGANIVALNDVDRGRLEKAATEHAGAKTWVDFRKMLEEAKNIDAVMVSTADHTHYPASMLALKLGKHVCTEKPLVNSIWEARQLAIAAKERKLVTQLDNENHSTEGMHVIVEMLRTGAIGEIKEVHIWSDRPIWPQGIAQRPAAKPVPRNLDWDLWIGPAPYRDYHEHLHPFAWRGWWDFGAGALGDMGCHFWDSAFWALDLGAPTTVEAEFEGQDGPPNLETFPKWAIITYQFPERPRNFANDPKGATLPGTWPAITVKWYDGHKLPPKPAELAADEKLPANGSLFVGTTGKLLINDAISPRLLPEQLRKDYKKPAPFLARAPKGDHKLDWLTAIQEGKLSGDDFALYGGPLTETVLLGNVAIRARKKVQWDAANMRATNCPELASYIRHEYRKGWEF